MTTSPWKRQPTHADAERAMTVASRRERLVFFLALGAWLVVPFFALQYHPVFPAFVMPATLLDDLVPLVPLAAWVYISLYAQLTVPLLLARRRDPGELRRMAFGFAWITFVSHALFLLWPTSIPALTSGAVIGDPLLRTIDAWQTSLNACPSLHASLAVYCALCAARMLRSRGSRVALWTWTLAILAATLLAKQHVVVDLVAGAILGVVAYGALFRARPADAPVSEALDATLRARNEIARAVGHRLNALTSHDGRKRAVEIAVFLGLGVCGAAATVAGWSSASGTTAVVVMALVGIAFGIAATALALNAFVLLMHEGMHDCLFRGRAWNRLGSVLLGSTFLMSFTAYRVMHTRHHTYLGDARDPDDYRNYTHRPALLWALHFVRLTFGSLLYLALIPYFALKYGSDRERRYILVEYAFLLVVYALALRFVPLPLLLVAWLIPLIVVGSLTSIRGFTQHGITDASDPYLASRTILPHPIVEFFVLHENYHLEHHLFPEVPSYHLRRLHGLAWSRMPRVVSGRGYLQFLGRFLRATSRRDETPIGLEQPTARSA